MILKSIIMPAFPKKLKEINNPDAGTKPQIAYGKAVAAAEWPIKKEQQR
jgi:hypothetical protein